MHPSRHSSTTMKKIFSLSILIGVFYFLTTSEFVFARVVEIETHPVIVSAKKVKPHQSEPADRTKSAVDNQISIPSQDVQVAENSQQNDRRFIVNDSDRDIITRAQPSSSYPSEPPVVSPPTSDIQIKERKFELGTEVSHIIYKEPIFSLRDKGNMYGFFGSYIYRPNTGNYLYNKFLSMYRLDVKGSYGKVDYESSGSGTIHHIDDYMFEIRGLLGKDYYLGQYSLFTPFAGLGWRYLNDDTGGRQSSKGASGYERESRYFYAPLGVEAAQKLSGSWLLSFTGEYDLFIIGQQTSHLSDVDGGLPDIRNKQHKGYGTRASIRLLHEGKEFNFFMEPFFRYWHIRDSDTSTATGTKYIVTGLEPDNNSTEVGLKLGIQYY